MSASAEIANAENEPARTFVVALGGALGALLRFGVEAAFAAAI